MATATETTSRPILFSAPMVRAILAGRKTQTRRVVKPQPFPSTNEANPPGTWMWRSGRSTYDVNSQRTEVSRATDGSVVWSETRVLPVAEWLVNGRRCPYAVGDELWVRETWEPVTISYDYYNGGNEADGYRGKVPREKPSWMGVNYRADGEGEGWWRSSIHMPRWASRLTLRITSVRVERLQDISEADARAEGWPEVEADQHPYGWFRDLWSDINGPESWAANPWVWVVSFDRVEVA